MDHGTWLSHLQAVLPSVSAMLNKSLPGFLLLHLLGIVMFTVYLLKL